MNKSEKMSCPLCGNKQGSAIDIQNKPQGLYFQCSQCDLISMVPSQLPSLELARQRYEHHEYEDSLGYRRFLEGAVLALESEFGSEREILRGLDFGCGSAREPILIKMLQEKGFRVEGYDLYFHNKPELLLTPYDFVVSTEVVEHFTDPKASWTQLVNLVKPGGVLVIQTDLSATQTDFANWSYRRDPTHVAFHSAKTMEWIAQEFGLLVRQLGSNLCSFILKQS